MRRYLQSPLSTMKPDSKMRPMSTIQLKGAMVVNQSNMMSLQLSALRIPLREGLWQKSTFASFPSSAYFTYWLSWTESILATRAHLDWLKIWTCKVWNIILHWQCFLCHTSYSKSLRISCWRNSAQEYGFRCACSALVSSAVSTSQTSYGFLPILL